MSLPHTFNLIGSAGSSVGGAVAEIPPTLQSIGTDITNNITKGVQYTQTGAGIYYINLTSFNYSYAEFILDGAGGGHSNGRAGGRSIGTLSSSSGVLWVALVVGGGGVTGIAGPPDGVGGYPTLGGFNGGGNGTDNGSSRTNAGSGGGACDIRINWPDGTNELSYPQHTRILVAGGGGGGTGNGSVAGEGGGLTGGNSPDGGQGGTQNSGGAYFGQFGIGGWQNTNTGWNGGGGGGWYGGGSTYLYNTAQHTAGGGGSSYYDPTYITNFSTFEGGGNGGDGDIRVTVY